MDTSVADSVSQNHIAVTEHQHGVNPLSGTTGQEQTAICSPRLRPRLFRLGDTVQIPSVQVAGRGQLSEIQTGVLCGQAGEKLPLVAWHGHTQGILPGKLGQGIIERGRHRGSS